MPSDPLRCEAEGALSEDPLSEDTSSGADEPGLLRHVAAILDGNRRWALQRGLTTTEGYRRGGDKVHEFLGWCDLAGIPTVTLWMLSFDNLTRDGEELRGLLSVITATVDEIAERGTRRIRPIGELQALPPAMATAVRAASDRTAFAAGGIVNIALAYSGRREILQAVRTLVAKYGRRDSLAQLARLDQADVLDQTDVDIDVRLDEAEIAGQLYTSSQPDPDLVIRTSGEQRLSNFMIWQAAYAEYYFTPTLWPDFSHADFRDALHVYRERARRFGR